jgi:hypothetical protein
VSSDRALVAQPEINASARLEPDEARNVDEASVCFVTTMPLGFFEVPAEAMGAVETASAANAARMMSARSW